MTLDRHFVSWETLLPKLRKKPVSNKMDGWMVSDSDGQWLQKSFKIKYSKLYFKMINQTMFEIDVVHNWSQVMTERSS